MSLFSSNLECLMLNQRRFIPSKLFRHRLPWTPLFVLGEHSGLKGWGRTKTTSISTDQDGSTYEGEYIDSLDSTTYIYDTRETNILHTLVTKIPTHYHRVLRPSREASCWSLSAILQCQVSMGQRAKVKGGTYQRPPVTLCYLNF